MSFWYKAFQFICDIGTSAANQINENANEIRSIKEKYQSLSDEELIRIANNDSFFGPSPKEKGVAFSILKARGYNNEDINPDKTL